MVDNLKTTINFPFKSIAYLKKRLEETPALTILLFLVFILQIPVGYHFDKSILFSLLFYIGNFIFLFITATVVLFFSYSQKEVPNYKHPVVQTVFILFAIGIVFFWFLGQFPNPAISENILTIAISSIIRFLSDFSVEKVLTIFEPTGLSFDIIENLSIGLHQTFVLVIFPFVLMFPVFFKFKKIKIQRFNYRLMTILLLLYIPFVFTNEKPLTFLVPYFITYLLIAFSEEYLFRYLLQSRLEAILKNRFNSIALASLMFGVIHIPIN